jgi:hypothetical protein
MREEHRLMADPHDERLDEGAPTERRTPMSLFEDMRFIDARLSLADTLCGALDDLVRADGTLTTDEVVVGACEFLVQILVRVHAQHRAADDDDDWDWAVEAEYVDGLMADMTTEVLTRLREYFPPDERGEDA